MTGSATGKGQTLAQKIVARASGNTRVDPGEIVTCKLDLAMIHDSGGPRRVKPILERLGVGVWDPDRVVVVSDHYVPAVDAESAAILKLTRDWVKQQAIGKFYDQIGICHVVVPEHGHLSPGMFVLGGDSHSPTGGAFGCFMFGVGATDMAGALATGETWLRMPHTKLLSWEGPLSDGVSSKDMMLKMCRTLGMDGGEYQVVQYAGSTIRGLPMQERMTLSNMAAELGAITGLIAPDDVTVDYIVAHGGSTDDPHLWQADPEADYLECHSFDASALEPQVAAPHSPANSDAASTVAADETSAIDQCYIGACTGAKLEDLHMAARVLRGRRVHSDTRLMIAPASAAATAAAAADGTLATLTEAGAILLPSGCGACAGYGAGVLAEGERCMASTARNFRGRMGARSSFVFLGSPYTVAATAVMGRIADPREFLTPTENPK